MLVRNSMQALPPEARFSQELAEEELREIEYPLQRWWLSVGDKDGTSETLLSDAYYVWKT